jgi:arylsulfatase A-like enzyme
MNVILVIFDSLRKDCVGVYGSPPWGDVYTPHLDAFAAQSLRMTSVYPESLPTLPARRAIYTGQRVYPFRNSDFRLKGDFVGAPGWGPIPEEQATLAEMLQEAGYRTGLIADLYHMFKPSKNYWRGFDQWKFLRGQEQDPARSGPRLTEEDIEHWLPEQMHGRGQGRIEFIQRCIMNTLDWRHEEDYFSPRVLREAGLWLEENQDADRFFLTVESFDPHEPWLVPPHYLRMYQKDDSHEQVISAYGDVSNLDPTLIARTQANYSAEVTMADRWFGHFMETLRVLGLLDNTMVVVSSDHGHSVGDRGYMGKRGYPSTPEVYDVPLMIRLPGAEHAGKTSGILVQHHDIAELLLDAAGVEPPEPIDGVSFLSAALNGDQGQRDHVTVGWGGAVTVITRRWWLNCKVDGNGVLLHDLEADDPFAVNCADEHVDIVDQLFTQAVEDAGGGFPEWLIDLAKSAEDAPGCSDLAARRA